MKPIRAFIKDWIGGFGEFLKLFFGHFVKAYLAPKFMIFEKWKSFVVGRMYEQRGKNAQMFANVAIIIVMVFGVALGPSLVVNDSQTQAVLASGFKTKFAFAQEGSGTGGAVTLGLATDTQVMVDPLTLVSEKPRADVFEYTVEDGDTLAGIAKKFGVDVDSIKWINSNLSEKKIKKGSVLKIPPVTGVIHTVKGGETIYSIAKRYNVSPQAIVDFPFNEFTNDETFALAIGQQLVVPDGEMPTEIITSPRSNLANVMTPSAGVVSATGSWIWPAAGRITQTFKAWHKGLDIANHDGGNILAADSGTVVVAGWPDNTGYGNRVLIDHGNGYKTLYAHLSKIAVTVGQTVKRGNVIGQMGSTGRSTGTHLHFEVRSDGGNRDPLGLLK